MRLAGKIALVTGASRGNGRAIALGLAREGADVVINYSSSTEAAVEVVAQAQALGRRAVAIRADTSVRSEVEVMVAQAIAELGPIDVLVNNAGILRRSPFLELAEEEWDRVLDVNLKGYFLVGQAVARTMVERGVRGSIIHNSSTYSRIAVPGITTYSVAKGGLGMLTKQMALELGPHGIRVNAMCPGLIETDINRDVLADPAYRQMRVDGIPLRKIGRPEDLVGLAVFLASDESALMTGAEVFIDGGVTVK